MATIREIAAALQVAPSTVSRALNDHPGISAATRQRVKSAAQELGYSLRGRGGRSAPDWSMIGVIVPELTSEYYARISAVANERLQRRGYTCIMQVTNFKASALADAIHNMERIRVQGLLLVVDDAEMSETARRVVETCPLPKLLISGRQFPEIDADCIYFDGEYGVRLALDHLLERGRRNIGFVGEQLGERREQITARLIEELRLPCGRRFFASGKERGEIGGYLRMKELLGAGVWPDAVIAGYDQMAIGAIRAIREAGLAIPRDIAIVGFDDISAAQYVEGGITTVATPYEDVLSIAVNVLTKKIDDPDRSQQHISLRPRLVVRHTS